MEAVRELMPKLRPTLTLKLLLACLVQCEFRQEESLMQPEISRSRKWNSWITQIIKQHNYKNNNFVQAKVRASTKESKGRINT